MRSIGEMARDSGLSVSALRFYDGAGVLAPARVDPVSGYRWYGPEQLDEARLLARLRRTGMPLADVRLVLAGWSAVDTDLVRGLLQAQVRRLERGLSEARSELSTVRALLDRRENPMAPLRTSPLRLTVAAAELAAALDAVRFAAGTDPELPVLGGVLVDVEDGALHTVATDRYRLAVARAAVRGHDGPPARFVVPSPLADAMRALLPAAGDVRLALDGDHVALDAGGREAAGQCLGHGFPDYRRLVRLPAGTRVPVDTPAFRGAVRNGPVRAAEARADEGGGRGEAGEEGEVLSILKVTGDGTAVAVCADGDDDPGRVAVNRRYLLDALDAAAHDRLVLEFGAPTAPLAIRRADTDDTFSVLMPVRLEN